METLTTRELIDSFIKQFMKDYKEKKGQEFEPTFDNLYKIGKIIETKVPDIVEVRKQKSREFKYVAWKWYEYILRKFDNEFWFELTGYSDNYQMVQITIKWKGKVYSGWYAVEDSALAKETQKPLNNKGEMVVNEGMRCFAKVSSRATGLFYHLWIEGGND